MIGFYKSITEAEYKSNLDSYTDAIVFTTDTQKLLMNGKEYGKDFEYETVALFDMDNIKPFPKYTNVYKVVKAEGGVIPIGWLWVMTDYQSTGTYQVFLSSHYSVDGTSANKIDNGGMHISYRYMKGFDGVWGKWTEIGGNKLVLDTAPTSGSSNGVTSGGVYNAIKEVQDAVDDNEKRINNESLRINDLSGKIDTLQVKLTDGLGDMETALGTKQNISDLATINGQSLNNGGEDIELPTYDDTELRGVIDGKQDALVSGENIKTINGESLLGAGNIEVIGGGGDYPVCSYFAQTSEENKATSINSYTDRVFTAFHFGLFGNGWGTTSLMLSNASRSTLIKIGNSNSTNYITVKINGAQVLLQSLKTFERIVGLAQVDLDNGVIRYMLGKGSYNALNGTEDVADIVEVSVPELADVTEPLYITTSYDSYRSSRGFHYHGIALGEIDIAAVIAYKPTIGGIMHPSVTQVLTPHQFSAGSLTFNGKVPMRADMVRNVAVRRDVDMGNPSAQEIVIGRIVVDSDGNVYIYNGTAWKLITNS